MAQRRRERHTLEQGGRVDVGSEGVEDTSEAATIEIERAGEAERVGGIEEVP